ncbi:MAG: hypothetical protein ABIO91_01740 [Pyrinomonadaceae bacterium]
MTNIKEVVNKSSKAVRVSAYDNKTLAENGHRNLITTSVVAAGAAWRGDMWVPWADNRRQFRSHFITMEIFYASPMTSARVLVFGVYQTGEEIRSSLVRDRTTNDGEVHYLLEDEYNARAPRIDGEWKSGGDRRVIFFDRADGSVGFTVERHGR